MREEMRIESWTARGNLRQMFVNTNNLTDHHSQLNGAGARLQCSKHPYNHSRKERRGLTTARSAKNAYLREITANSGTPVTLLGFAPFNVGG